jgi:hypothetical protein
LLASSHRQENTPLWWRNKRFVARAPGSSLTPISTVAKNFTASRPSDFNPTMRLWKDFEICDQARGENTEP